jgi:hypothetical protein
MKKWIFGFVLLLTLGVFFLPASQTTETSFVSSLPAQVVLRELADTTRWSDWWPGQKINDSSYLIGQKTFVNGPVLMNGFTAKHGSGSPLIKLRVSFQPNPGNQSSFNISSAYLFSKNPFSKAVQYLDYLSWKKSARIFSDSVKSYFTHTEKIYGFSIRRENVPNADYISASLVYREPPAQATIDSLVTTLRSYANTQQATMVNQPIMHVIPDSGTYKLMVALPINREIPSGKGFQYKQMILGYILIADVQGGPHKIQQCQEAMERYMMDHGKSSPAIPFQRMLTDRAQVKDSSKWITAVNYPVFQ